MADIVEHVAKAIDSGVEDSRAINADLFHYYYHQQPESYDALAKLAIRATLKAYAEDFWDKTGGLVPLAGLGENATVEQQSAYVEVWHYSELARAFDALLAELDRPESRT